MGLDLSETLFDNILIDNLFDSSVRAETIIHLASMAIQDSWSASVNEAFNDDLDEIVKVIGIPLSDDMERAEMAESLIDHQKLGWLVKFSTPTPSHFHGNGRGFSFSTSWGLYASKWFYGEDYEMLCVEAVKWRDEVVEQCRERWKKDSVA